MSDARSAPDRPRKLNAGQKHLLRLIQKEADAAGWAPVSKAVMPLFTDPKIPGGPMPSKLCQFERQGAGGRARLTDLGHNILEAMEWL